MKVYNDKINDYMNYKAIQCPSRCACRIPQPNISYRCVRHTMGSLTSNLCITSFWLLPVDEREKLRRSYNVRLSTNINKGVMCAVEVLPHQVLPDGAKLQLLKFRLRLMKWARFIFRDDLVWIEEVFYLWVKRKGASGCLG